MTHITIPSSSIGMMPYVEKDVKLIDDLTPIEMADSVKVFINGAWIGITMNPLELFNSLKKKKYMGIINIYTSFIFDYRNKEIKICND